MFFIYNSAFEQKEYLRLKQETVNFTSFYITKQVDIAKMNGCNQEKTGFTLEVIAWHILNVGYCGRMIGISSIQTATWKQINGYIGKINGIICQRMDVWLKTNGLVNIM